MTEKTVEERQQDIFTEYEKTFGEKQLIERFEKEKINPNDIWSSDGKVRYALCGVLLREMREKSDQSEAKSFKSGEGKSFKDKMEDYITYEEVLKQLHEKNKKLSISARLIPELCNFEKQYFVAEATVITDKGTFTETADATAVNTNKMISIHAPRMALTRAKARAGKDALGIGKCSREELQE